MNASPVRHWRDLLTGYIIIGGICFVIDFSILRALLISAKWQWALAATVAFVAANSVHFSLNKWTNFRNHDRQVHEQFGTYITVLGVCLAVTLLTIGALGHFGISQLAAKVVAVIINIPIGFLGHRYLTFASGIRSKFQRGQLVDSATD